MISIRIQKGFASSTSLHFLLQCAAQRYLGGRICILSSPGVFLIIRHRSRPIHNLHIRHKGKFFDLLRQITGNRLICFFQPPPCPTVKDSRIVHIIPFYHIIHRIPQHGITGNQKNHAAQGKRKNRKQIFLLFRGKSCRFHQRNITRQLQ